jgi:PAS domain S-box-containing protein
MTGLTPSSTPSASQQPDARADPGLAQLEALVANVPGVVYRCTPDADWTMHFLSDQILELCGYPARDFVSDRTRTYRSVIHPADQEHVDQTVGEAARSGQPFVITYRIVRADGRVRWVMERGRQVIVGAERWLDGIILDVTAQHEAEQALLESMARQATLEERGRIARDLHDSVSQALFSISLHARAAQLAAGRQGTADGPVHRSIGELLALSNGALAEMRALIFELRPGALQQEGLTSALRKHAAAIASREELDVTVSGPAHVVLGQQLEETLYRVVQEALHNAVKHAEPSVVTVTISERECSLHIEICDDGIGFDIDAPTEGSYGLANMRERAEAAGGSLQVRTRPGTGTTVAVDTPLPGDHRSATG